jgi:acetylornithine deacetylase/succinyl-diaminopimelate desuccinylase-like protein
MALGRGRAKAPRLRHALHELKAHFEDQNPGTDSLNIGKINGGHGYNIVPSKMVAAVEIRYLNKDTLKEKQAIITNLCKKYSLVFEQLVLCPPVLTDLTHPLVKSYMNSVKKVVGKRPQSFVSSAASDAPPLYEVGVNCILSCCFGGDHHKPGEWISRKSFLQFVPILRDYLAKTARL